MSSISRRKAAAFKRWHEPDDARVSRPEFCERLGAKLPGPTRQKYVVRLSKEERAQLHELLRKGKSAAKLQLKARILLKADVSRQGEGWSDSQIIKALNTSVSMVYRVRQQLVEEGFEAVLNRKQRATPAVPRIFDGEKEAKLITLACSSAPAGRARWTLSLLADKVVELKIVDAASASTVGRVLKKTSSSPTSDSNGSSRRDKTARLLRGWKKY